MYMRGRVLQLLRVPGLIRPFEHQDEQTGEIVRLRTSPRYTILSVGGKEFFFERETGKFDGTGAMSIDNELPINYCMAARIRRSVGARAAAAQPRQS